MARISVRFWGILVICLCWAAMAEAEYKKYKDPKQPINVRIKDLMSRMTLEEKIGQMTQIDRTVASGQVINKYLLGSVLSGGGSVPAANASAETWIDMVNGYQVDPELVKRIGAATALEVRATGIHYTFAPCIAVCRDPRWGRCFESYSEDHKIVQAMTEIISGLQGEIPANSRKGVPFLGGQNKITACAKHYLGDGGTTDGINENNTVISRQGLLSIHMPAYLNAIVKGVSTVMISYSSWNGLKMHANHELITGYLKNKLRFRGFVISDWQGLDRITSPPHANYTYSVLTGIHAGIDMVMIPFNYTEFIDTLTSLVNKNFVPMTRIDDAVRRILRVKFTAGLFEHPYADYSFVNELGSQEHRELAREAVRKTLVLLKNGKSDDQPLLPLPKKARKILVAGTHADDLGNQCGGWTITWQGLSGEPPYSEQFGDSLNLTLPEPGPSIITNVCRSVKCVVVLITGRPVVIQQYVPVMDALVAAWLPGTEGRGVADVLFGDYGFVGKLSRTWFKTVDQLPMNIVIPFGFLIP
ncbi:hypothetical protein C3L33_02390, partial [Rhododendron williamsianum]